MHPYRIRKQEVKKSFSPHFKFMTFIWEGDLKLSPFRTRCFSFSRIVNKIVFEQIDFEEFFVKQTSEKNND